YYAEGPEKDPRGPGTGKMRVLRGGAWDSTPDKCRSAYRHKEFPTYSDACFGADSYGFRRARKGGTAEPGKVVAKGPETPAEPTKPTTGTTPVAKGKINLARLKGTIVFVSDRSGTLKIWNMHASGKNPRQLTKGDEADADPRFAPDGKRIMYTTLRGGFPEVWMMNRDGLEPKFVTKGSQAGWAPDGTSIVSIRHNQTFVRALGSGEERLIAPRS